jgi:hypothetical protein
MVDPATAGLGVLWQAWWPMARLLGQIEAGFLCHVLMQPLQPMQSLQHMHGSASKLSSFVMASRCTINMCVSLL